jgi:hypothetical protein
MSTSGSTISMLIKRISKLSLEERLAVGSTKYQSKRQAFKLFNKYAGFC